MTRRVYKGQHTSASGTEILRDGALAVDLATNTLYIHDGSTPGGVEVLTSPSNIVTSNAPSAGAIDITKQMASLVPGAYTVANGVEGQVLFLTVRSGAREDIDVTFANIRYNASNDIRTSETITPFWGAAASNRPTLVTCIFTNGAWTLSNGLGN
jgi:hypothetical protein